MTARGLRDVRVDAALSVAHGYPMMLLYAVGSGLGFGLTALAVTLLLLNYYGRRHNLEIFSLTCLIGAVSALGPVIGGVIRDRTGGFAPAFQLFALVIVLVLVAVIFMRPPRRQQSPDEPEPVLEPASDPMLVTDLA